MSLLQWIGSIVALIVGLTTIFRFLRAVYMSVKRVEEIWPLVNQLEKVMPAMQTIAEQMSPNGGSSVFDRIGRIDENVQRVGERVRAMLDASERGIWESDIEGEVVYLSPSLLHLLGINREEGLGRGWISSIHVDDRDKVRTEWFTCVKDRREFQMDFRVVTRNNESLLVMAHASPIRSDSGKVLGFMGWLLIPL